MPLPETKAEETKPAEPKPEAKVEEKAPPTPAGPFDGTIAAPKYSVKLVSPGKGKREALKFTPKQGDKQQVELAIDFGEKQTAPAELGGDRNDVVPTVLLSGPAEVKSVDKDGKAEYQFTVNTTDARQANGTIPEANVAKFKEALVGLQGLTIGGTIDPNGMQSDLKLHMDQQKEGTQEAVQLLQFAMPHLPILPTEPVGVGAKWTVINPTKVADKVDLTQTTDYELVSHKGNTWTIKGTTKVSGKDQDLQGAKLSKITGGGAVEATISGGALYPAMKSTVDTGFTITVTAPDPSKPTDPPKEWTMTIQIQQGAQVAAKS
ncbi:MAG: hypothetical protein JWO36_4457 [Myxococcales bacterium]|nr:hypothetical protein [Myxococcales bacterium]